MTGIAWDIDGRSTGGVGSVCCASGIVGTRKGVERSGLVISVGRDRANLSTVYCRLGRCVFFSLFSLILTINNYLRID